MKTRASEPWGSSENAFFAPSSRFFLPNFPCARKIHARTHAPIDPGVRKPTSGAPMMRGGALYHRLHPTGVLASRPHRDF